MWFLFAARSFDVNMPKRRLMFIIFAFIAVHWLRILTTNNDWMWLEVLKFTCSASLRATSSRPSRTDLPSRLSISRVLNEKCQSRRRQSLHTCDLPNSWWKTFDTSPFILVILAKFLMKNLSYKGTSPFILVIYQVLDEKPFVQTCKAAYSSPSLRNSLTSFWWRSSASWLLISSSTLRRSPSSTFARYHQMLHHSCRKWKSKGKGYLTSSVNLASLVSALLLLVSSTSR